MLCLIFSIFGEFQAPPIGWNMNYSMFSRLEWICFGRKYSWNDAKEDRGKKDYFGRRGRGLTVESMSTNRWILMSPPFHLQLDYNYLFNVEV